MRFISHIFLVLLIFSSCQRVKNPPDENAAYNAEHITNIQTGTTKPSELISFACSLEGTPYKFGSKDPKQGFDCSGFITYVFNHFNIAVPRMSVDFAPVHRPVELKDAAPGDLILFTGSDSTVKIVGHMGIVTANSDKGPTFIHAESGKNTGVIETNFDAYYRGRYIKTIRIFPQEDNR